MLESYAKILPKNMPLINRDLKKHLRKNIDFFAMDRFSSTFVT
ncbi:hypothetical protein P872_15530 [Rhodonellum psychrophilum GCM71 = DSM 17998]|uniref:Uncharacterized protein n=1 Tax=Rhodonellum psychrophilum GCM71 = DSM 17998 TaxID=1123057 RepID=U5C7K1_9BACT|nr:hypothetical protein P872_15530 [Rhodonellum psychrophilum GCM71 = DSM 17998]